MNKFIKFSFIFIFSLFIAGCGPKFEIALKQNEFRNTKICKMKSNVVKKHNSNGTLVFNLEIDTEEKNPYALIIKELGGSTFFKDDSHAHLKLVNTADKNETLYLRATSSDHDSTTSLISNPGYYVNGVYIPGSLSTVTATESYVYFKLTKEEMKKIVTAKAIQFEIETQDKTIQGTLAEKNIENLREFQTKCLSS